MNKRATLFHWLIFGVLIALGIFFLSANFGKTPVPAKGEWQIDFLTKNYLPAQVEKIKQDIVVKNVGVQVLQQLARQGGHSISPCGSFDQHNLWNSGDVRCYPPVTEYASRLGLEILKTKIDYDFTETGFSDSSFYAKGSTWKIKTPTALYIYKASSAVPIGYDLDDYDLLKNEATTLIQSCRNSQNLQDCLDLKKLPNWKYTDCNAPEYKQRNRQVKFCVTSPHDYSIADIGATYVNKLVLYNLALDFTPSPVNPITDITATQIPDAILLDFQGNQLADSYNIYYTTWPGAENFIGTAEEYLALVPPNNLGFLSSMQTTTACTNCQHIIQTPPTGTVYITVTPIKGTQEGEIDHFTFLTI